MILFEGTKDYLLVHPSRKLIEFCCFGFEHQEGPHSKECKESQKNQPVPPRFVWISFHRIQQIVAVVISFGIAWVAIFELGHQNNSQGLRMKSEIKD